MWASETTSPIRVIKPKAMKNNKGRGVIKLEKWADVVYGWTPNTKTVYFVKKFPMCRILLLVDIRYYAEVVFV